MRTTARRSVWEHPGYRESGVLSSAQLSSARADAEAASILAMS